MTKQSPTQKRAAKKKKAAKKNKPGADAKPPERKTVDAFLRKIEALEPVERTQKLRERAEHHLAEALRYRAQAAAVLQQPGERVVGGSAELHERTARLFEEEAAKLEGE